MHLATLLSVTVAAFAAPNANLPSNAARKYFNLVMTVGSGSAAHNVTLSVLPNSSLKALYLVGNDPAVHPGTPAYFTGQDPHKLALHLNVFGVAYGVAVPDIGDIQDTAELVAASPGYQEFKFQAIGGSVYHELSSGSNMWLACDHTVNGQAKSVLAWGAMGSDGTGPEGCSFTRVYQDFSTNSKSSLN